MSEESKKKSKPECPLPKEMRENMKNVAEIVDKHKKFVKKINPLDFS
ncbi:hypothetical protein NIES2111_66100 (plasmid) [Nostoc sp. NIES-2111]|nr:hypothetical protein NIES2111_66100 [Nostoc sp. NIES-2111]